LVAQVFSARADNTPAASYDPLKITAESPEQARQRHEQVASRRKRETLVICHRGSSEFCHENTLEAFRTTFELGADGNEFDIRLTRDGVLVVFHDDMLDRILEAYGDVGDYTWEELRRFRFRSPGKFGAACRIPTLVEVFELHRRYAGLMHLDVKRQGLDQTIIELIERMDLWDHVAYCNHETCPAILAHPRYRPRRYKTSLYADRSEMFPEAIAAALKMPGEDFIVDDPRGAIVALGRKIGKVSAQPVAPVVLPKGPATTRQVAAEEWIALVRNARDWNHPGDGLEEMRLAGQQIVRRAYAADQLLDAKVDTKESRAALAERVRNRSLHKDWMYHGLDGAQALQALLLLRSPGAIELARETLWRDDPELERVKNPKYSIPRSWTDFRVKMVIFPALERYPGADTEKLCRDYLALSDEAAAKIAPPQFEQAARALLSVAPSTETALELLQHRLQTVRGRIILHCLAHANEAWARAALEKAAPFALRLIAE
jgi:hypothetical protein